MAVNNNESEITKEQDLVNEGVHTYTKKSSWIKPEEENLQNKLEWFKEQKLGLMIHWGIYSQLGIRESWPLVDNEPKLEEYEDVVWNKTDVDWTDDYEEFKRQYFELNKSFNPIRYQPNELANIAADNGFKYLIFTTKHHDGFCMWDTSYTEYKITNKDCPFHTHKYADVVKSTFDAFRDRGLSIAAYFSKPDWHSEYYWTPGIKEDNKMSREPSYFNENDKENGVKNHLGLWEKFVDFTHKQMTELISKYGKIDMLWLDGGWVQPLNGQDLQMDILVPKLRSIQPDLLVVDRTVGGVYENYITPEQEVPDEPIDVPWESCITMGTRFSFYYDDEYKSLRELVHLLIDIVCKGGNLALNIGLQPDGRIPKVAQDRIEGLGDWLNKYGDAIYGTRVCAPYKKEKFAFTQKGNNVYAFLMLEGENDKLQDKVIIPYEGDVTSVSIMGIEAEEMTVDYKKTEGGLEVQIPKICLRNNAPIAYVFKMQRI